MVLSYISYEHTDRRCPSVHVQTALKKIGVVGEEIIIGIGSLYIRRLLRIKLVQANIVGEV